MAFRDEIGGAAVNILPSEKPSDIYQLVADQTISELQRLAAQNEPKAKSAQEDDRPSDAELAQWWLDYGVTRKVTKRNCMTFPYGVVNKPSDIYQLVADRTVRVLKALVEEKCPQDKTPQEDDRPSDAELAQVSRTYRWLSVILLAQLQLTSCLAINLLTSTSWLRIGQSGYWKH